MTQNFCSENRNRLQETRTILHYRSEGALRLTVTMTVYEEGSCCASPTVLDVSFRRSVYLFS